MFKYNPQQALTDQPLGIGYDSTVYPYLEGQDDTKWVVKCIRINDPERINSLLQNILTTSSASYGSVVPIKGYDIHRDDQGGATAYLKMPRMQQSLKDQIQSHQANQQVRIPVEQIVQCFHSIASCLDELAQKEIAHRNLKPSNVLIDRNGHVYLSDIQMVEPSSQRKGKDKEVEMEARHGYDEDLIYKAPEIFHDHWAKNEEDLHKADAWSMGMVIAKACLIDSLTPISPDLPMEENRDIIEQNLAMIAHRYGQNLAGILRRLLALDPRERETFSTIRDRLEETYPQAIGGNNDGAGEGNGKPKHKIIDIRGKSSVYLGINEESTILDEDLLNERPADNNSLLGFNRPKWIKPEWFQLRRSEWLNITDLKEGFVKRKRYVAVILVALVLLLLLLAVLRSSEKQRQNKFVHIMTGIQFKHGKYFNINFEPQGNLEIVAIWSNTYTDYYNERTGQYYSTRLNDEILINLMNDITTELESADLEDHLKWFKIQFLNDCHVTDTGITRLQASMRRMTKLEGFSLDLISGPSVSIFGLQQLYNTLSEELDDLNRVGVSFESGRSMSNADIRNLVSSILDNKKVTGLYFSLFGPTLSEDEYRELAQMISDNGQHLEALRIGFRNYDSAPSNTILKTFNSIFLSKLDGLKELVLDFTSAPLTDDALDALATGVTSQKKLRRFELILDGYQGFFNEARLKYLVYELSRTKLKDLKYVAIQTPSVSRETRSWLRSQLQYVPEVHITPEN